MNNKQTILGFVALIAVLILGVVYYTRTPEISPVQINKETGERTVNYQKLQLVTMEKTLSHL